MIVFQVQLTYGAMGSPQHCSFSELNHRVSGTELKPGEEHVGLRKEGARISGRRGSGLGTGILKGEAYICSQPLGYCQKLLPDSICHNQRCQC